MMVLLLLLLCLCWFDSIKSEQWTPANSQTLKGTCHSVRIILVSLLIETCVIEGRKLY